MNLVQAIHQRWAASAGLDALLPVSRVYTGISVEGTTPYAVITKQSDRPWVYLSDGSTIDRVGVRVEVFHDDYDAAAAIMHQVKAAFDRADLTLTGGDRVINVQRLDDSERQDNDGLWRLTIDFLCTVFLETGV